MNEQQINRVKKEAEYGLGSMEEKVEAIFSRHGCVEQYKPMLRLCQAVASVTMVVHATLPEVIEEAMESEIAHIMASLEKLLEQLGHDNIAKALYEAAVCVMTDATKMRDNLEKAINQ